MTEYQTNAIANLENLKQKICWVPDEKEMQSYIDYIASMNDYNIKSMQDFKAFSPVTYDAYKKSRRVKWEPVLWTGNPMMQDMIECYAKRISGGLVYLYRHHGYNREHKGWSGARDFGANSSSSMSVSTHIWNLKDAQEWIEYYRP